MGFALTFALILIVLLVGVLLLHLGAPFNKKNERFIKRRHPRFRSIPNVFR